MNQNIAILLFSMFSSIALAEAPKYESWTAFRSDYGYEVRYPSCWKPGINDPDEKGDLKQIKNIDLQEGDACKTPPKSHEISNGIGVSVSWNSINSQGEMEKEMDARERVLNAEFKNKKLFLYKKTKTEGHKTLLYVESLSIFKKYIRWRMEIFCDSRILNVAGPSIEDPAPSYFEKFKAGEIGLPEPEKTIYESIRCINPKIKSGK